MKTTVQTLTPEILVPRLGEYLVQQGHISEQGLRRALRYQKKKQPTGGRFLLGEALLELKLIDRKTLDHAITEQIIQLRNALEDANKNLERRVQERTAELQEALRRLSELNQLKANFIANISHELRTPLTHIKGYIELLATGSLGPLTAEQAKGLEVSQRAVGRLEAQIENLIMFSVAARGEITLKLVPVDLRKIAENIFTVSRPRAADRKVVLEMKVDPDLPRVKADEEKISWVILQLVDNAIKFTPKDGKATLSIQPESDSLVMVSVSDTGIGIPSDRLDEIFEPFHQLDGSSTRRYSGTGLGLALVREIVSAHGSMIEVDTQEGRGSTFRFPLVRAEVSSA